MSNPSDERGKEPNLCNNSPKGEVNDDLHAEDPRVQKKKAENHLKRKQNQPVLRHHQDRSWEVTSLPLPETSFMQSLIHCAQQHPLYLKPIKNHPLQSVVWNFTDNAKNGGRVDFQLEERDKEEKMQGVDRVSLIITRPNWQFISGIAKKRKKPTKNGSLQRHESF
ncbi:hypothetical protein FXO37_32304 [Capsicum annuum]|nr:hypothetical protein FXO37_32304 [Capsicum annuum]